MFTVDDVLSLVRAFLEHVLRRSAVESQRFLNASFDFTNSQP
jgi:hypothetical protein